ncbi:MAG: ATPase, partial [Marinilabiliales bacterium]
MQAIQCKNIRKTYEGMVAVDEINFEVQKAELFGLIGPDGAGKTSIFRILTTLLIPDSGRAFIDGMDVVKEYKEIRRRIGYMPGKFSLYQDLSVEENLNFFATIFGTTIEENYHLIEPIYKQIESFKKRKAGALSGGMKQKLALSCALIHSPSVLVLDEPTTGVDAVSRKEFWEMLKDLQKKGISIIVSTPYMDEASLCDRVALIQKGKIMSIASPVEIIQSFGEKLFAIRSLNMLNLSRILKSLDTKTSIYPFGQFIHYTDSRGDV